MFFSTSCWMHSRLNCFRRTFLNFLVKRSRFVIKSLPIYSILSKIESLIHACSFAAEFSFVFALYYVGRPIYMYNFRFKQCRCILRRCACEHQSNRGIQKTLYTVKLSPLNCDGVKF